LLSQNGASPLLAAKENHRPAQAGQYKFLEGMNKK
jgi:hypothetical protein